MALSTKPLGGMRQRYPEELNKENYVTGVLRRSSLMAGFQEYDGPVMEPLALFAAKSGGELVERQSYSFTDRGRRQVILRPEMTPSLARMVAARGELQLPVRWFSMPLCYRYERPQRGRVREFLQYNLDILGSEDLSAELEVILVLSGIMKSFGAGPSIYRIGWSSRSFISDALARFGVPGDSLQGVLKAMDRRDKMQPGPWEEYLEESCGGNPDISSAVKRLVNTESVTDPWLSALMEGSRAYQEVCRFQELLEQSKTESAVFSPGVVRGLDYYTGIVFELMDTGGENRRALCGGGRYDNLVGLFGSKRISGVGFGMGVLTMTLFLETYGLIPESVERSAPADVFVAVFSPDVLGRSASLVSFLREKGIRVMMDVSGRKMGRQYREAARLGIQCVVAVGPEEIETGVYTMKNMISGSTVKADACEMARILTEE